MAATTEGGIEAQEKAGQLEQAERNTLPIDLGGGYLTGNAPESRKPWEALGFVFSDRIVDDIFVEVTFPTGWKKRPTDHSMWSDIVDDKGRKRGAIFYKAAFYDRKAHAHLDRRFGVSEEYPADKNVPTSVFVSDKCGIVQFKVSGLAQVDWSDRPEAMKRREKIDEARKTCIAYLVENFPEYDSPLAYWD